MQLEELAGPCGTWAGPLRCPPVPPGALGICCLPCQLGSRLAHLPWAQLKSHSSAGLIAAAAPPVCAHLQPGDVVVMGSDGLFDNLWEEDLRDIVQRHMEVSL